MAVLGLLALMVVTATTGVTTASASGAANARSQSNGAKLDRALRAWAGFPVRSSPRRLVLLQGYVLNPDNGFPDDNSKEAFLDGDITAPASWPVSPASSMGFPIVGAAAAFKPLTTPTSSSTGSEPPPLGTTAVQLGSGLFLTDRGWRVLPAWLYSLSRAQNPAKVLAVAPSDIYAALITSGRDVAGADVGDPRCGRSADGGDLCRCRGGYRTLHRQLHPLVQGVEASGRAAGDGAHPHVAANGAAVACTLRWDTLRHATVTLESPRSAGG